MAGQDFFINARLTADTTQFLSAIRRTKSEVAGLDKPIKLPKIEVDTSNVGAAIQQRAGQIRTAVSAAGGTQKQADDAVRAWRKELLDAAKAEGLLTGSTRELAKELNQLLGLSRESKQAEAELVRSKRNLAKATNEQAERTRRETRTQPKQQASHQQVQRPVAAAPIAPPKSAKKDDMAHVVAEAIKRADDTKLQRAVSAARAEAKKEKQPLTHERVAHWADRERRDPNVGKQVTRQIVDQLASELSLTPAQKSTLTKGLKARTEEPEDIVRLRDRIAADPDFGKSRVGAKDKSVDELVSALRASTRAVEANTRAETTQGKAPVQAAPAARTQVEAKDGVVKATTEVTAPAPVARKLDPVKPPEPIVPVRVPQSVLDRYASMNLADRRGHPVVDGLVGKLQEEHARRASAGDTGKPVPLSLAEARLLEADVKIDTAGVGREWKKFRDSLAARLKQAKEDLAEGTTSLVPVSFDILPRHARALARGEAPKGSLAQEAAEKLNLAAASATDKRGGVRPVGVDLTRDQAEAALAQVQSMLDRGGRFVGPYKGEDDLRELQDRIRAALAHQEAAESKLTRATDDLAKSRTASTETTGKKTGGAAEVDPEAEARRKAAIEARRNERLGKPVASSEPVADAKATAAALSDQVKVRITEALKREFVDLDIAGGEASPLGAAADKIRALKGRSGTVSLSREEAEELRRDARDRAENFGAPVNPFEDQWAAGRMRSFASLEARITEALAETAGSAEQSASSRKTAAQADARSAAAATAEAGARERGKGGDLYHGTSLIPGERIPKTIRPATETGVEPKYPGVNDPRFAYATSLENAWEYALKTQAARGGIPVVFKVEPKGEVEKDPARDERGTNRDVFESDVRSREGFRVVRKERIPDALGPETEYLEGLEQLRKYKRQQKTLQRAEEGIDSPSPRKKDTQDQDRASAALARQAKAAEEAAEAAFSAGRFTVKSEAERTALRERILRATKEELEGVQAKVGRQTKDSFGNSYKTVAFADGEKQRVPTAYGPNNALGVPYDLNLSKEDVIRQALANRVRLESDPGVKPSQVSERDEAAQESAAKRRKVKATNDAAKAQEEEAADTRAETNRQLLARRRQSVQHPEGVSDAEFLSSRIDFRALGAELDRLKKSSSAPRQVQPPATAPVALPPNVEAVRQLLQGSAQPIGISALRDQLQKQQIVATPEFLRRLPERFPSEFELSGDKLRSLSGEADLANATSEATAATREVARSRSRSARAEQDNAIVTDQDTGIKKSKRSSAASSPRPSSTFDAEALIGDQFGLSPTEQAYGLLRYQLQRQGESTRSLRGSGDLSGQFVKEKEAYISKSGLDDHDPDVQEFNRAYKQAISEARKLQKETANLSEVERHLADQMEQGGVGEAFRRLAAEARRASGHLGAQADAGGSGGRGSGGGGIGAPPGGPSPERPGEGPIGIPRFPTSQMGNDARDHFTRIIGDLHKLRWLNEQPEFIEALSQLRVEEMRMGALTERRLGDTLYPHHQGDLRLRKLQTDGLANLYAASHPSAIESFQLHREGATLFGRVRENALMDPRLLDASGDLLAAQQRRNAETARRAADINAQPENAAAFAALQMSEANKTVGILVQLKEIEEDYAKALATQLRLRQEMVALTKAMIAEDEAYLGARASSVISDARTKGAIGQAVAADPDALPAFTEKARGEAAVREVSAEAGLDEEVLERRANEKRLSQMSRDEVNRRAHSVAAEINRATIKNQQVTLESNALRLDKEALKSKAEAFVAQRKLTAALNDEIRAVAKREGVGGSFFGRLLGFNRGVLGGGTDGMGGTGAAFGPGVGGFFAGGVAATLRYGIPSMLMYGGMQTVREMVGVAEQLELEFTLLEHQLESTFGEQSASIIRRTKEEIIALSKETGITQEKLVQAERQIVATFGEGTGRELRTSLGEGGATIEGDALVANMRESTAQLSKITELEPQLIQDQLRSIALAFGVTGEVIGDALVTASDRSGMAVGELMRTLSDSAASAESAGFEMSEYLALIATVSARAGGRGAASVSDTLSRVVPTVLGNREQLTKLGLEAPALGSDPGFIRGVAGADAQEVLFAIGRQWERLNRAQQQRVTEVLGGERNVKDVIPALQNLGEMQRFQSAIENESAGELDSRYAAVADKLSVKLEKLKTNFQQLGMAIYEAGVGVGLEAIVDLLTQVANIIEGILGAVGKMNDWLGGIPVTLLTVLATLKAIQATVKAISTIKSFEWVGNLLSLQGLRGLGARGLRPMVPTVPNAMSYAGGGISSFAAAQMAANGPAQRMAWRQFLGGGFSRTPGALFGTPTAVAAGGSGFGLGLTGLAGVSAGGLAGAGLVAAPVMAFMANRHAKAEEERLINEYANQEEYNLRELERELDDRGGFWTRMNRGLARVTGKDTREDILNTEIRKRRNQDLDYMKASKPTRFLMDLEEGLLDGEAISAWQGAIDEKVRGDEEFRTGLLDLLEKADKEVQDLFGIREHGKENSKSGSKYFTDVGSSYHDPKMRQVYLDRVQDINIKDSDIPLLIERWKQGEEHVEDILMQLYIAGLGNSESARLIEEAMGLSEKDKKTREMRQRFAERIDAQGVNLEKLTKQYEAGDISTAELLAGYDRAIAAYEKMAEEARRLIGDDSAEQAAISDLKLAQQKYRAAFIERVNGIELLMAELLSGGDEKAVLDLSQRQALALALNPDVPQETRMGAAQTAIQNIMKRRQMAASEAREGARNPIEAYQQALAQQSQRVQLTADEQSVIAYAQMAAHDASLEQIAEAMKQAGDAQGQAMVEALERTGKITSDAINILKARVRSTLETLRAKMRENQALIDSLPERPLNPLFPHPGRRAAENQQKEYVEAEKALEGQIAALDKVQVPSSVEGEKLSAAEIKRQKEEMLRYLREGQRLDSELVRIQQDYEKAVLGLANPQRVYEIDRAQIISRFQEYLEDQRFAESMGDTNAAKQARNQAAQQLANLVNLERDRRRQIRAEFEAANNLIISTLNASGDTVAATLESYRQSQAELQEMLNNRTGDFSAEEISNKRGEVVQNASAARDAIFRKKMEDIDFALAMEDITQKEAIDRLVAVRKLYQDDEAKRREIDRQIKSLQGNLNESIQFNLPDTIKLPTLYEARRLNQSVSPETGAAIGYQDNRTVDIKVYVTGGMTPEQVTNAVAAAVGTNRSGYYTPRTGV